MPLVSILTAAYHAGGFLPAALASIARQTHQDWELIVVEDGSHDETEPLVRAFSTNHPNRRIVYDNLGENRGVAAARNRLLALARGDVVAFLDADDRWFEAHLASLVACLAAGPALAFTGIELWDGRTDRAIGRWLPDAAWLARPRRSLFQRAYIQTSSCVALPRTTLARVGGFDESLRIGEDRDFWFRAVADGRTLGCTFTVSCRYTKHAASSMTRTLRVAEDTVRFFQKHQTASDLPVLARHRHLAHAHYTFGRLIRSGDPTGARSHFTAAFRLCPWRIDYAAWAGVATLS